ncbi:hypothetical protein K431DRAFT_20127 [Polychaeton citri CBS 116435]|uniref:DUF1772-domain-containing protein n=1 Tax=Polychaeton citri CBS 116435 TaxID=1314669 RepID=A0A9P4UJF8_9PEZI|nr:hypothetical protein K431DRAFT_20127 [Polychaeton citri CBS 116435]
MASQLELFVQAIAVLKAFAVLTLALIAGASYSMSLIIIPLIQKAPHTKAKTVQFASLIGKGAKYMQPTSRIMMATLTLLSALLYRNAGKEDVTAASSGGVGDLPSWKGWMLAAIVVAQVAWFEVVAIFPFNDIIGDVGRKLMEKGTDGSLEAEAIVSESLEAWRRRNLVRASLPLLAAVIGMCA